MRLLKEKVSSHIQEIVGLATKLIPLELDSKKKREYVRLIEGMEAEQKGSQTTRRSIEELEHYATTFNAMRSSLVSDLQIKELTAQVTLRACEAIALAKALASDESDIAKKREYVINHARLGKELNAFSSPSDVPAASLQIERLDAEALIKRWNDEIARLSGLIKAREEADVASFVPPARTMSLN